MQETYSASWSRRGSAAWLVAVAVLCAVTAGIVLWLGRDDRAPEVVRTGETAEPAELPGAADLRGGEVEATTPSGTAVAATPEPAALASDGAAAPRAVGGWTMERIDTLLDSFWGREPDIDRLLALIRTLGEHAVIDPTSVARDDADGTVRGRVEVPELGLRGQFTIERNRMGVDLETTSDIEGVEGRSFSVALRTGEIGIEQATAYVHHVVYEQDEQRQHDLAVERHPVGWEIRTSRAHGTVARPLMLADPFAYEHDDKGPIPIPVQYTGEPVAEIRDAVRIDTGPWQVWRDKIEPHKQ